MSENSTTLKTDFLEYSFDSIQQEKIIIDESKINHSNIAKLLMEKYHYIYRCASIKYNIWYEFKNHRWIEIDSAYALRKLISNELVDNYVKYQVYLYNESRNKDDYTKEKLINEARKISSIINKLQNVIFKNGVIRECANIVYDPNFFKEIR